MTDEKKFTVFDFIKDINFDKKYLYNESTESEYVPWTVNVSMAMFPDTLHHSIFLNANPNLDKQMQHDYLFYSVNKRKRFKQNGWLKKSAQERNEQKIIEDVARVIKYNLKNTKVFFKMLNENQKKEFLNRYVYPDDKNRIQ